MSLKWSTQLLSIIIALPPTPLLYIEVPVPCTDWPPAPSLWVGLYHCCIVEADRDHLSAAGPYASAGVPGQAPGGHGSNPSDLPVHRGDHTKETMGELARYLTDNVTWISSMRGNVTGCGGLCQACRGDLPIRRQGERNRYGLPALQVSRRDGFIS